MLQDHHCTNADPGPKRQGDDAPRRAAPAPAGSDQAAAFLSAMVEAIPHPVFVKDGQGVYLGCNSTFAAFVGKGKEEIAGRTARDLFDNDLSETDCRTDLEL